MSGRTAAQGGAVVGGNNTRLEDTYLAPLTAELGDALGISVDFVKNIEPQAKGTVVLPSGQLTTSVDNLTRAPYGVSISVASLVAELASACQDPLLGPIISAASPQGCQAALNPNTASSLQQTREHFNRLRLSLDTVALRWDRDSAGRAALTARTRFAVSEDQTGLDPACVDVQWSQITLDAKFTPRRCGQGVLATPCAFPPGAAFEGSSSSGRVVKLDMPALDISVESARVSDDAVAALGTFGFLLFPVCTFATIAGTDSVSQAVSSVTSNYGAVMGLLANVPRLRGALGAGQGAQITAGLQAACGGVASPMCQQINVLSTAQLADLGGVISRLGVVNLLLSTVSSGGVTRQLGTAPETYTPFTFTAFSQGFTLQTASLDLNGVADFCASAQCSANNAQVGCMFCGVCNAVPACTTMLRAPVAVPAALSGMSATTVPPLPGLSQIVQASLPFATGLRRAILGPIPSNRRFASIDASDSGAPWLSAPLIVDGDQDGVDDSLDVCPGRSDGQLVALDTDNDKLPDQCDNCPANANPSQANCNFTTEVVLGRATAGDRRTGTGDVCDATPCADTRSAAVVVDNGITNTVANQELRVDGLDQGARTLRTGLRFCQCPDNGPEGVSTHLRCERLSGCTLARGDSYPSGADLAWHAMQARFPGSSSPSAEAALGYRAPGGRFQPRAVLSVSAVDGVPVSTTWDGVGDGLLWTHTPGPAGTTFAQNVRDLSSHYLLGGRWLGRTTRLSVDQLVLLIPALRWMRRPGVDPDPLPPWVLPNTRYLGLLGGQLYGLGVHGATPVTTPATLTAALTRAGRTWVMASGWRSTPSSSVLRAVGLDAAAGFVSVGSALGLQGDALDEVSPYAVVRGVTAIPAGVRNSVLSTERSELWTVGGDGKLWALELGSGRAALHPQSAQLGTILAMTYSVADDALLVLEQQNVLFGLGFARLLRVTPGSVQELGRWARLTSGGTFQLAELPDGKLALLSSSSMLGGYRLAVYARVLGGLWLPSRFVVGAERPLVDTLQANEDNVSFMVTGNVVREVSYDSPLEILPGQIESCF